MSSTDRDRIIEDDDGMLPSTEQVSGACLDSGGLGQAEPASCATRSNRLR
jgi:hypothetical protein